MALLLGTDEAGYGPNLGPLVISASLWEVPDSWLKSDLYERLETVFAREGKHECRLTLADSKQLYKPGGGLANLETGVLTALNLANRSVEEWSEIWSVLSPESEADVQVLPWYTDYVARLPVAADRDQVEKLTSLCRQELARQNIRLAGIRSRVIFPRCFNRLLEEHSSKGAALSHETVGLVAEILEDCEAQPTLVQCDKHGGRNRYAAVLQSHFDDAFVEVIREGRSESTYRWGPKERRTEVRFCAGGESFLPAALASMTSKYLRELAMLAFNTYWQEQIPDIRPTAGYPVDAKRFKKEIAPLQSKLGIEDHVIWRNK